MSDDFFTHARDHINRAGFEYQGDYAERSWAHTTFGYRFEDENGSVGDVYDQTRDQRLPAGTRFLRSTADRLGTLLGRRWSALPAQQRIRQHGSAAGCAHFPGAEGRAGIVGYAVAIQLRTGFKEPRLEETFAGPPFSIPNPGLKPERTRRFRSRLRAEPVGQPILAHSNLLQQSVSRPDRLSD